MRARAILREKVEYCAFSSESCDGELINRYVDALIREMEMVAGDLKPETIFFGGGTPSLLTLRQWERILNAMARLNLLGPGEWTVAMQSRHGFRWIKPKPAAKGIEGQSHLDGRTIIR